RLAFEGGSLRQAVRPFSKRLPVPGFSQLEGQFGQSQQHPGAPDADIARADMVLAVVRAWPGEAVRAPPLPRRAQAIPDPPRQLAVVAGIGGRGSGIGAASRHRPPTPDRPPLTLIPPT